MRLDDDGVARGQAGEQAGIAVPGREGGAADHQRHAARHHGEVLFHADGIVLALRLFPDRDAGNARHFLPRVGHGLEAAVLCVRTAGLEGHHEALAGGVLHRVSDLEAQLVQARQDFHRHADPGARAGAAPLLQRLGRRGHQLGGGHARIGDAQVEAIGDASPPTLPSAPGRSSGKGLPRSARRRRGRRHWRSRRSGAGWATRQTGSSSRAAAAAMACSSRAW